MRLIFLFDMIFKTYMTQATCKSAASSLWFYKLHVPHIVKLIVPRIENKGCSTLLGHLYPSSCLCFVLGSHDVNNWNHYYYGSYETEFLWYFI